LSQGLDLVRDLLKFRILVGLRCGDQPFDRALEVFEEPRLLLVGVLIQKARRLLDNNKVREVFDSRLLFSDDLHLLLFDAWHLQAERLRLLLGHAVSIGLVNHSDNEVHENNITNDHDCQQG